MPNSMPPRRTPAIAWPGLLVLFGGICAYWLAQNELNTSRPEPSGVSVPNPVGPNAVKEVYSRMWEDPLAAAHKDTQKPPADEQDESIASMQEVKTYFANLVEANDPQKTLCIPVLVDGGPYAEDKETRLRTRYAVATALAHAGYALKYPDRLSYATVNVTVRTLKDWKTVKFDVPVKYYRFRGGANQSRPPYPKVLVLWVNESQLGLRPLLALHRLTDELFGDVQSRDRLCFRIIGPSSSDVLDHISQEIQHLNIDQSEQTPDLAAFRSSMERPLSLAGIISKEFSTRLAERVENHYRATILEDEWYRNPGGPLIDQDRTTIILSPRATLNKKHFEVSDKAPFETSDHFRVIRTIGNDHLLVSHAIYPELKLRGAWPQAERKEVVVLLTEQDSSYGRHIVDEFVKVLVDARDVKAGDDEQPDAAGRESGGVPLRVFKYFRGIDGQTAVDSAKETDVKKTNSETGQGLYGLPTSGIPTRPPQGESQYDYLRRLKDDLRQLKASRRVTAIGVVGSDVYDKLLIMRALRPHFPDAVFFTTDLDAIYIHPDEQRHTRNLIVASHFGLEMNPRFHDAVNPESGAGIGMLPFRDSYQTAEHLTTRIALEDDGIRDALKSIMTEEGESENVFEMSARLWDHEHNHAATGEIEGVLRPLLTTVGHDGFRQLAVPPLEAERSPHTNGETLPQDNQEQPSPPVAGSLQPAPTWRFQPMRAPWILFLVAIGAGLLFVWEDREQFRQMLGLRRAADDGENDGTSKEPEGRKPPDGRGPDGNTPFLKLDKQHADRVVNWLVWFFWGAVLLGIALTIWMVGVALSGWEQFVLDGTSVLPRVGINIVVGLLTAGTLVHFANRIVQRRLDWKVRTNPSYEASELIDRLCGDDPYSPQLREFCHARALKLATLWIVCSVWCIGVLTYSIAFELITIAAIAVSALIVFIDSRGRERPGRRNISGTNPDRSRMFRTVRQTWNELDRTKKALLTGSFAALAILAIGNELPSAWRSSLYVYGGWGPELISRGLNSRLLDSCAMLFGYCMILGLLVTVLYGQHWCREFTRHLRRLTNKDRQGLDKPNEDGRVESLILIGEATAVTGGYTPWLLGYMLVMILAYHPLTSPVPVPAGLLVMMSLSILLLVSSTLYLRFVVQRYRGEVLYELRGELFEERRSAASNSTPSKSPSPEKTGEKKDKKQKPAKEKAKHKESAK